VRASSSASRARRAPATRWPARHRLEARRRVHLREHQALRMHSEQLVHEGCRPSGRRNRTRELRSNEGHRRFKTVRFYPERPCFTPLLNLLRSTAHSACSAR
jgi:hypothetical protein